MASPREPVRQCYRRPDFCPAATIRCPATSARSEAGPAAVRSRNLLGCRRSALARARPASTRSLEIERHGRGERISGEHTAGRFSAQVSPVALQSGRRARTPMGPGQFGTNPASGTGAPDQDNVCSWRGLGVGYQRGELVSADIGTSPLGFLTTNLVGGIEVAPKLADDSAAAAAAERRMVTDSLLSYGGARIRSPAKYGVASPRVAAGHNSKPASAAARHTPIVVSPPSTAKTSRRMTGGKPNWESATRCFSVATPS